MNCFLFLLVLVSGACAELSKEAEVNADIRFLKNEMRALKQQQQTEVMALKQQQEVQQAEIEILKRRLAGDSSLSIIEFWRSPYCWVSRSCTRIEADMH